MILFKLFPTFNEKVKGGKGEREEKIKIKWEAMEIEGGGVWET